MAARNSHFDIVRVLSCNAILRAGVPNSILGRKLAFTLDLRGADFVVIAKAPMGNVTMVADPIQ